MSEKYLKFFLLFLLFGTIRCQGGDAKKKELQEKQDFALKYLFLFSGIIVVSIIRHVVRAYNIVIPYSFFCLILGFVWGIGSLHSYWMYRMSLVATKALRSLGQVFIPVLVFSIAFCIDAHAFFRSLPQILIISIPVALISASLTGIMMRLVIDHSWGPAEAILFGSLFIATYPREVIHWLRETTIQTKYVTILLEGETLITCSFVGAIYQALMLYLAGFVVHWYQFAMGIVRPFVVGIVASYAYSLFATSLMKLAYNDSVGLMIVTVAMCYSGYYLLMYMFDCGIIGTILVGVMMSLERASLSQETDRMITSLWSMISCTMNGVVFLNCGVMAITLLHEGLEFQDYALVVVTYLMVNISRFVSFLIFSPILSRIGYGMSLQSMIICVWGGLKNPVCLDLALFLYYNTFRFNHHRGRIFLLHTVAVYLLMLMVNGTSIPVLMRALGLSDLSMSRKINMSNCMKYINEARLRTVAILKMDRFLSDANWPLVMLTTNLRHPYKDMLQQTTGNEDEDEEENFMGFRYTFCPDCQKNVLNEPTAKEFKEMIKEAKLRLLKLKKTAYSRQFENGMISKEGIRILHQCVEIAMDSDQLEIELDGLFKLFYKEGIFFRFLKNRLVFFLENTEAEGKPPRKHWRLICYRIVNHGAFVIFIYVVLICNIAFVIRHCIVYPNDSLFFVNIYGNFVFVGVYLLELILKVSALSWIYVYRDGVRNYFRSHWNILEFIVLLAVLYNSIHHAVLAFIPPIIDAPVTDYIIIILLVLRMLKLVILLKYCACCKSATPAVIKYIDVKVDRYRALAFELGKNYIAGEEEILRNLHQIIDNEKIRDMIKEKIESDRLAMTRTLGIAQKESPHVAITVKTKLAMRTVLNSMHEDAYDLKVSGWVDDIEYGKLLKSLAERYKFIRSMKTIQQPSSKLIFREVSYMGYNDTIIDFLYNNVSTKKFDTDELVYNEGEVADAIYVLITGMLMVEYTPKQPILEKLREFGSVPVADYICSMSYAESMREYIVPGNTLGEMSVLSEKPYNAVVTAETYSQLYVLSRSTLVQAFEMDSDPVNGLECRMWKYLGFKPALTVMMNTPSYRSYTQDKIKYILERSFVPDVSNYKVFVVNNMMQDLILLQGVIMDFNTNEMYTAPCYIPRACQRLVLPESSFVNMVAPTDPKLLIIPAKDCDEYEIMLTEEQTGELIDDESPKCLRRLIEQKGELFAKNSKTFKHMKSVLSGLRKQNGSGSMNKLSYLSAKGSRASKTSRNTSGTRVTSRTKTV